MGLCAEVAPRVSPAEGGNHPQALVGEGFWGFLVQVLQEREAGPQLWMELLLERGGMEEEEVLVLVWRGWAGWWMESSKENVCPGSSQQSRGPGDRHSPKVDVSPGFRFALSPHFIIWYLLLSEVVEYRTFPPLRELRVAAFCHQGWYLFLATG